MSKPQLVVMPNANTPRNYLWTTFTNGQLTSSVVSLRDAVERADRNHYSLRLDPGTYDEMVWVGVAKSGLTPGQDLRDFVI